VCTARSISHVFDRCTLRAIPFKVFKGMEKRGLSKNGMRENERLIRYVSAALFSTPTRALSARVPTEFTSSLFQFEPDQATRATPEAPTTTRGRAFLRKGRLVSDLSRPSAVRWNSAAQKEADSAPPIRAGSTPSPKRYPWVLRLAGDALNEALGSGYAKRVNRLLHRSQRSRRTSTISRLSKPTRETSSGSGAQIAKRHLTPMAIMSLAAKMAVGRDAGRRQAERRLMAAGTVEPAACR